MVARLRARALAAESRNDGPPRSTVSGSMSSWPPSAVTVPVALSVRSRPRMVTCALDAGLAVAGVVDRARPGRPASATVAKGIVASMSSDCARRPASENRTPEPGRHDVDEVALGRDDVLAAQLDRAEPGLVGREVVGPLRRTWPTRRGRGRRRARGGGGPRAEREQDDHQGRGRGRRGSRRPRAGSSSPGQASQPPLGARLRAFSARRAGR